MAPQIMALRLAMHRLLDRILRAVRERERD
jgi:hypothetical protein